MKDHEGGLRLSIERNWRQDNLTPVEVDLGIRTFTTELNLKVRLLLIIIEVERNLGDVFFRVSWVESHSHRCIQSWFQHTFCRAHLEHVACVQNGAVDFPRDRSVVWI